MKKILAASLIGVLGQTLFPVAFAVAQTKSQKGKITKIEGFVTKVESPTRFEIGDYKIARAENIVLTLENQANSKVQFKPENIRVGTEIEVEGDFNQETNELAAKKVTVDLDQFGKLTNTTVLSNYPFKVEKTEDGAGWRGTMWADGRRIAIEPTTQILFALNKSERKAAAAEVKKNVKNDKTAEADNNDAEFADAEPLKDVADVKAGMFMTYEAVEQPDGSVVAARVKFMKNEAENGERNMWNQITVLEKPADPAKNKLAEVKINTVGKFKLLPNKEVQDYVQRVGYGLVPTYQKELPSDDPQKIKFRFMVVVDKEPNAFATPNGIVVVNSGLIELLENEAQLASVMAHEIAHATQEHTWRTMNKDRGKKAGLLAGAIAAEIFFGGGDLVMMAATAMNNKFARRLENQADRIGLQYLVAAGYDPREAPRVWQLMGKKFGDNAIPLYSFIYASHSAPAVRRGHLTSEILTNYQELEFDKLRRNAEDYEPIVRLTAEASVKPKDKRKKDDAEKAATAGN